MYEIELSKKAIKFLKTRDKKDKDRLFNEISKLSYNPRNSELDIKLLKNKDGIWRLRVGSYRVLYSIFDDVVVVLVLDIGNRGDIYK